MLKKKKRTGGEQAGQPQVNQGISCLSKYSSFSCSAFVKKHKVLKYFFRGELKKNKNKIKKYIWFFFGKKQINFGSIPRGSKEKANQPGCSAHEFFKSRATPYSPKGFTTLI